MHIIKIQISMKFSKKHHFLLKILNFYCWQLNKKSLQVAGWVVDKR